MRIDGHHHLWVYEPAAYDWIDDTMRVLRRDFLVDELQYEATAAHVDATLAVQARQTLEETHWLLSIARQSDLVRGVVGWAPIADQGFPAMLPELCTEPLLKGLRHVVQAEPSGFLARADFNRGISALRGTGLVYDLLILAHQLEEAIAFVDQHPGQIFVLDHIAKPDIRGEGFANWAVPFRELARRDNVYCKLSGMVTEADWQHWSAAGLKPYFDHALDCFTPSRLIMGSDWPVLNVASLYAQWWQVVEGWLQPLSRHERAAIEGTNAASVYRIALPHPNGERA